MRFIDRSECDDSATKTNHEGVLQNGDGTDRNVKPNRICRLQRSKCVTTTFKQREAQPYRRQISFTRKRIIRAKEE